jgi:hypothetical protein
VADGTPLVLRAATLAASDSSEFENTLLVAQDMLSKIGSIDKYDLVVFYSSLSSGGPYAAVDRIQSIIADQVLSIDLAKLPNGMLLNKTIQGLLGVISVILFVIMHAIGDALAIQMSGRAPIS